jgi:hypothetical protein
MKPPESIQVVTRMCDMRMDHVLRCFGNPEGLNYQVLALLAWLLYS